MLADPVGSFRYASTNSSARTSGPPIFCTMAAATSAPLGLGGFFSFSTAIARSISSGVGFFGLDMQGL